MTKHNLLFQRNQLWRGAMLSTIAHAIWITPDRLLSYEVSWDGINYSRNNTQGTRGTITFHRDRVVAVFCDDDSPRAPWHLDGPYTLEPYSSSMPDDVRRLAEQEAFQYVVDDVDGWAISVVTAAFWSDGEALIASEPWAEVLAHGAHLIETELMHMPEALEDFRDGYEWADAEIQLLQSIFTRRMEAATGPIYLEEWEWAAFIANGTEGLEESRALLADIGIMLPHS